MFRSGNGVEVRDTSIFPAFTDQRGVACRETIYQGHEPLAPTPPNVRYAHRVAEEIRRHLRAGTFTDETYAEFFPHSKRARSPSPTAITLGKLFALWISSKGNLEVATRYKYEQAAKFWQDVFGEHALVARGGWRSAEGADGSSFWETGREESRMKNKFGGRCLHLATLVTSKTPLYPPETPPLVNILAKPFCRS